MLKEITISKLSLNFYRKQLGDEFIDKLTNRALLLKSKLGKSKIVNINSTSQGGGVAEMLYTLPGYGKELGIDLRWYVIDGDQQFFNITKRIHNFLHDDGGDGYGLCQTDFNHYHTISIGNAIEILELINEGDIVILHDPQTAGLIPTLKQKKVKVIWRCHIGFEGIGNYVKQAWSFLEAYLCYADAFVFSRQEYVPEFIKKKNNFSIIAPSVDLLSTKNQKLKQHTIKAILGHIGIIQYTSYSDLDLKFKLKNGQISQVKNYADIITCGPQPHDSDLLALQVSRWDRLKDMLGVMNSFADYVVDHNNFHLVLAGPSVNSVSDDPEGVSVFNDCLDLWRCLPHFKRSRIQLVCLPMKDIEENGIMVNALQRHATVVVQKSLCEGFGLTVTEALIKGKAVLASNVGGIRDQIIHGETGLLVENPTDLQDFGNLLKKLLQDDKLRNDLGRNAYNFSHSHFLVPHHLNRYLDLFDSML